MDKIAQNVDALCQVAKQLENDKLVTVSKFLKQRVNQPDSYLVFLGESCSGKSTLINKIIGKDILPVSSVPSTGAITEVHFDRNEQEEKFYAINKNATMERLKQATFCNLALRPDANLERLRWVTPATSMQNAGVRIFDTPGYGSLVEEHEEVLMNFLPNCDAVVYTISYRIGIQEEDYSFLQRLMELVRYGVPVYLLINRCPRGIKKEDRRVKEIYQYVASLLQNDNTPLVLVESFTEEDDSNVRSQLGQFWENVLNDLNSSERKEELKRAFTSYAQDLATLISAEIERRIRNVEMDEEQRKALIASTQILVQKFENAEKEILVPGFNRIMNQFPKRLDRSAENIRIKTCEQIESQSKFDKDETGVYIKQHLLPYNARQEVEELQFYLGNELDALDKEVNDYLNKAIIQFESDLKLRNMSETGKAGVNAAKGIAGKLLNSGLLSYFAKFGGAGGSSAGIANAASHALKKIGNLFGKTFSRETHNALKHVLAKLGLTSTKVLGAAAAGIIDSVIMIADLATWKSRLCGAVGKTTNKWKADMSDLVAGDLEKLRDENINNLREIAKEFAEAFEVNDVPGEDLDQLYNMRDCVGTIERSMA